MRIIFSWSARRNVIGWVVILKKPPVTDVIAGSSPSGFADRARPEAPLATEPQDAYLQWPVGGHLRASDADRERAVDVLKTSFVQGRLTKSELARRVGQALESKTYADLACATARLPAGPAATAPPRQPRPAVRARPVNWKVISWVAGGITVTPGLAVAFFATYYGSFYILLLLGFVASALLGTPGTGRPGDGRPGADRH